MHVIRGGKFQDEAQYIFDAARQERVAEALNKLWDYLAVHQYPEPFFQVELNLISGYWEHVRWSGFSDLIDDADNVPLSIYRIRWMPTLQPGYRRMTYEELCTFYGVRIG
jgi:hypothetical protein